MEQYIIKGGNPLVGEVEIAGAKNAALGILAAAIMTDETVTIDNPGAKGRNGGTHPYICGKTDDCTVRRGVRRRIL